MPESHWDHVSPIAPGEVIIHIGPPKTGSTSLQTTMSERRDEMRELGALYPGSGVRAKFSGWAVMGVHRRGMRAPRMEEWEELVAEVNESGLRSIVSSEAWGRADEEAIGRMVESFGADRVHVVAVGRRLDKALPSLYQEKIKKFMAMGYEDWLEYILAGDDLESLLQSFPPGQQLGLTVEKWARHIDPSRFHLICSDERDRALVPRTFERLLGLPEGFLEPGDSRNESIDLASVEMLRRLNEEKKQREWTDDFYRKMVFYGAVSGLRKKDWTDADEKVPTPPEWALDRIRTLADHTVTRLQEQGTHLIGDPASLRPGAEIVAPASPLVGPELIPIDSAVAALAAAVEASWKMQQYGGPRRSAESAAGKGQRPGQGKGKQDAGKNAGKKNQGKKGWKPTGRGGMKPRGESAAE